MQENLSALLTWQVPNDIPLNTTESSLKNHSLGQRASALILFVLSQRDNDLIIIDQPEDDLDNQTIYEDVIKLVRKLKPETQFIFATHNPNIPVLGDAEQIIACAYSEDAIQPTVGSIDAQPSGRHCQHHGGWKRSIQATKGDLPDLETAELLEIVARGEDSRHQFKEDVTNAASLAAEIVAFANSGGGRYFIGVANDGTIHEHDPVSVDRLNQLIANAASILVRPPINPLTENVPVSTGVVIVVTVPMDSASRTWTTVAQFGLKAEATNVG